MRNQNNTLTNAKADLAAKEGDPSVLIVQLTQARNTAALEAVRLENTRLSTGSNAVNAYISLYENQENIKLQTAQVALDQRNLEVARARLQARNGTQLDVDKAQNSLAGSRQTLTDLQANQSVLSNRLETQLGRSLSGNLTVAELPALKTTSCKLEDLEKGLEARSVNVLQNAQQAALNELNVQLSDNDYTAPTTLRDNKTNLENARRNLETTRQNALTSLRDAWRQVQNAAEQVRLRNADLENNKKTLTQDQARFRSGTISRLALQQTEVATLRSAFQALQAENSYLRALGTLSTSAGVDCTGMMGGQG
ncbi:MAG: TolC family protein [Meiothermus sp.]|nr:TolC family protein [Meiothermus sp.]